MLQIHGIGKALIVSGIFLVIIGVLFLLAHKLPWINKLPGDIYIHRKGFSFYFPLTTCILASVIISLVPAVRVLVLWLLRRR